MSHKRTERFQVDDDEDGDIYDPKSKAFCRACIDLSAFGFSKDGPKKHDDKNEVECPLDKSELGRASWSLLHTMAAYYPVKPTLEQQQHMHAFLHSFSLFYPCHHCAIDFRSNMTVHPPKLDSRQSLSGWLCRQHNLVNKKLNKPLFDCSRVLERWRYGWKDDNRCNVPDPNSKA